MTRDWWIGWVLLLGCVICTAPTFAQQLEKTQTTLEINIAGVDDEVLSNNVRSYLELLDYAGQTAPASFRLRYLARRGDTSIKQALEPFGYYHTQVSHEIVREQDVTYVNYKVDVGQQTQLALVAINITGEMAEDPEYQRLRRKFTLKEGQPFIHANYEKVKSQLRSLAAERGYYDATFTQQDVTVELSTATAAIQLSLDSGERYAFGDVSICCNHLSDDFLQRYFQFSQGEPFHTRELLDLQVALVSSDYFENVEVAPLWDEATAGEVPVSVRLTPNQRDFYQIGPGYGTDTRARLTLAFDRRWINDRGHRLSTLMRLSEVQNTGFIDYIIPGTNPARDQYSITGEIKDRSYESLDSTLYKAGFRDTRYYDDWQRTYQLAYLREDFRFGDNPRESSTFLVPSAEFSWVKNDQDSDNRNLIDNGLRFSVKLQGASNSAGSDASFVAVSVGGKAVHSLTERWRVLARGEFGVMRTSNFDAIPPSLRFFAGGDHSVRGYAYQQLGPENEDGVIIGGRYLGVTSVEFDYLVAPDWRVAVFSDYGNSGMEWSMAWRQSIGVGVRWLSPIGPVRLDVAQAIDEPNRPWRLHLTIGPDL
ncbi:outer membrane protein assembly factor [Pseudidiomarina sediminum]|uniref:Translocation and assembly module subunit TamA n=1 Tax=Pseudidiomarina sediminum TaxID=431675 RepID=A0A432YZL6_9GAMM|nr:autotransporter assembly complex family protein [Pseudidiomarina sediminum]MBY6065104.1 autotransporter assembly complex protein TamA [Pseudidiomarina sediminum]RUO69376.1 outer membrane protein assembly factor [Pseudidiomarina sediminum]